jgi:hypothetical protein
VKEHRLKIVCTIIAVAAVSPLFGQYGGPAILARGEAPAAMAASQIDFRPFATLGASFDSGLGGVSVDTNGQPTNAGSVGIDLSVGISGLHSWKHTKVGLTYNAAFSHYTSASFYDSFTQNFLLGITHQISRHTQLSINNAASLLGSNLATSSLPYTVQFDPSTTNLPTNEFYDNRTYTVNSQASLQYQQSRRLSLSFGGQGFITRRRSTALYGVTGGGANADLQYRLTRRSTVGARYTYTHYAFTGIFSSLDAHSVVGTYSVALSRSTEFSGYAGITRFENKIIQTVPIDPAVAALIGVQSALRVSYQISYTPNISARISRTVLKGTLFGAGSYLLNPGNGLFLTSKSTTGTVGYSYTGVRRWAISGSGSYNRSDSVGIVIGTYGGYSADLTVSRQVAPFTHGLLSLGMRKFESGDFQNYNKWSYVARLSLAFTPGDVPLRLW